MPRRIPSRLLLVPLLCAMLPITRAADPPRQLTAEQWRADLQVLATTLPKVEKHVFRVRSKADFERDVKSLDAAIPNMTDAAIRAGFMKLVASTADRHTVISAFAGQPLFSIAFLAFPEGYFVTATTDAYPQAPTARLVAINGMPVQEVERRLLPYVAQENRQAAISAIPNLLRQATPLQTAGIIPTLDEVTYTLERDGKQFDAHFASNLDLAIRGARAGMPRAYREYRNRRRNYWFEALPDAHAVYLQYDAYGDEKDEPFQEHVAKLAQAIDESHAERLIIDLRFNGGGLSNHGDPLLDLVKTLLKKSGKKFKVFALVGRDTYSAAFLGALHLQDLGVVLVGEAMGQRTPMTGGVEHFNLPNSGIVVQYAKDLFKVTRKPQDQVEPDVTVAETAQDFFAGKDAVLDYALSH